MKLREARKLQRIFAVNDMYKIFSGILAGRPGGWIIKHKALSVFQVGFIKDRQTIDNAFVNKTTIDKY